MIAAVSVVSGVVQEEEDGEGAVVEVEVVRGVVLGVWGGERHTVKGERGSLFDIGGEAPQSTIPI
jgi:hypothetical protein